ncbi:MAG: hypothetical protein H6720_27705, partial [Sandaracinus sp.]|nr:hypothetical protein [Sandaracinus sp.]
MQRKARRLAPALLLALAGFGCGGGEEAAAELNQAAADLSAAVANAAPATANNFTGRIGGQVAVAGGFAVEVLPIRDGSVQAVIMDGSGAVVSNIPEITVQVQTAAGGTAPVTLRFDAALQRYVGALPEGSAIAPSTSVAVSFSKDGQEVSANVAKMASAPAVASHGGTVVVVGEMSAEVVAKPDQVIAWVEGPDGQVSGGDAEVTVMVPVVDAPPAPVTLVWSAEFAAYVGTPTVAVAPGPITFTVEQNDTTYRTSVASVPVVRPPSHEGTVVVAGDYSVEVVPDDGGQLKAYVVDVGGAPVTADATVNVTVGADHTPVTLTWDAAANCYVGAVEPTIDVAAAPIAVAVVHRGRRVRGGVHVHHVPRLSRWHEHRAEVLVERGNPPAWAPAVGLRAREGADVRVRVDAPGLRGPAASVMVQGPGANVRVQAPGVGVSVMGPGGAVRVVGPGGGVNVVGPGGAVRVTGPGGGVSVMAPGVSVMGGASVMVGGSAMGGGA